VLASEKWLAPLQLPPVVFRIWIIRILRDLFNRGESAKQRRGNEKILALVPFGFFGRN